MHDVVTVGIPVLVVLLGILLNQRGVERLEIRMNNLELRVDKTNSDLGSRIDRMDSELSGRIDRMQADLSRFYQILGEHGGKIEMLFKK